MDVEDNRPENHTHAKEDVARDMGPQETCCEIGLKTFDNGVAPVDKSAPTGIMRLLKAAIFVAVIALATGFFLSQYKVKKSPVSLAHESFVSAKIPIQQRPAIPPVPLSEAAEGSLQTQTAGRAEAVAAQQAALVTGKSYSLEIGPFVTLRRVQEELDYLSTLRVSVRQHKGKGPIHMVRLSQGVFPAQQAHALLKDLQAKKISGAFLLGAGKGKLAVYSGSFVDVERAKRQEEMVRKAGFDVKLVTVDLIKEGTMLSVDKVPEPLAHELKERCRHNGIHLEMTEL